MKKHAWLSKWLVLPVVVLAMVSVLVLGFTLASFNDVETSSASTATAWTSTNWTQTSQTDFNAGVLNSVNTTASPGDVILASNSFNATNSPGNNTGTAWTNPANAYADGGGAATITSGNPSGSNVWGNYGYAFSGSVSSVRIRYDAWSNGVPLTATAVGTGDGAISGTWEQVNSRVPTADGDNNGTWLSAPRWSSVNKRTVDDSTYMTGNTSAGGYMLFTFDAFSIPAGATITDVTLIYRAADVISGTNNIRGRIKVNGTYYDGSSVNPGTSFLQRVTTWTTNPNTGSAWTVDDVNGIGANPLQQIGVYSTDLNPNINVSLVNVQVTFTTAPTSRYSTVNSTIPDDSKFLRGINGNSYQLSTFPAFSIPAGSTIANLTIYYRAADTIVATSGANNVRAAIQVNGTVYRTTDPGNDPSAANYTTYSYAFTTNPNTGSAWTVADINGSGANPLQQFGVASSDAAPDFRVSMYYAVVNYYDPLDQIEVDVSWDGGTSWSATANTTLTITETTYWYDVTAATSWDPAKLADVNLLVRALAQSVNNAEVVNLDWLAVEVIYRQYVSPGTIASPVLNTNVVGSRWDGLAWDMVLAAGTNVTFEVRARDASFAMTASNATLAWIPVGGTSPVIATTLPAGRYKQWRATLSTTDVAQTPVLNEIRLYYYGPG